jgi:tetratricopeptide (TPR) repeat protein
MRKLPEYRAALRWAFLAVGIFLIVRPDVPLNEALSIRPLTALLFPDNRRYQDLALIPAFVVLMQAGILSLVTAWGLHRGRKWSKWTARVACLSLLPGFPWFTLIGMTGLLVIVSTPLRLESNSSTGEATPNHDYWNAARNSHLQKVITFLSGAFLILGLDGSAWMASRLGLPEWTMGWEWWLYLFAFLFTNTAMHELGHAAAAWALHHRVRVISVGPLTFTKDARGYSFHIQWNQLLESSGYMRSVPTFNEHVRLQLIVVVAAGPLVSLFNGLLTLAAFLSLPGTRWQGYWEFVAMNGVVAFAYVLISIAPFGYTDGNMLRHLLIWTRPGQMLVENNIAAQMYDQAHTYLEAAAFEKQVVVCEELLTRALSWGDGNARAIAICQQRLGSAKAALGDWTGADIAFRRCLQFEAECVSDPALGANAWALFHSVCVQRHNIPEAERVYAQALAVLQQRRSQRSGSGLAVTSAMLAELHQRAGHIREGLEETTQGLSSLSLGRDGLPLRAVLLSAKAYCEIRLGSVASGLSTAAAAIEVVRSGKIYNSSRRLAWSRIGDLGLNLSRAGQSKCGIDLLREAISNLNTDDTTTTAASQKIKMARILRGLGRHKEAENALPVAESLPGCLKRALTHEQVELAIATGHFEDAVHRCEYLVSLWRREPDAIAEVASAEAIYAIACLETGRYSEADNLAQRAASVLEAWQHPDALRCHVTFALAKWRSTREWIADVLKKSVSLIERDPLLTPTERAWLFAEEADRLEKHGRSSEGEDFRRASLAQSLQVSQAQASAARSYM